jgi:hypothetical protein
VRNPSTGNFAPPGDSQHAKPEAARDERSHTQPDVDGHPAPREPHERDESSDSGAGAPSELMRQAAKDAESGKTGSDKGEATDAVYKDHLRGETPGAERD